MALTAQQIITLRADIAGDVTLNAQPNNSDGAQAIANVYNTTAAPAFVIWRYDISASEVVAAITFTDFVTLTAIKQQGLMLLLIPNTVDASSVNVRNAFSSIFPSSATLTALIALAKRNATRGEKLFATGTGTDATPAVTAIVGGISATDVLAARAS